MGGIQHVIREKNKQEEEGEKIKCYPDNNSLRSREKGVHLKKEQHRKSKKEGETGATQNAQSIFQ